MLAEVPESRAKIFKEWEQSDSLAVVVVVVVSTARRVACGEVWWQQLLKVASYKGGSLTWRNKEANCTGHLRGLWHKGVGEKTAEKAVSTGILRFRLNRKVKKMFKVWIEKTLLMTDHEVWGQSGRVWGIGLSALCGVAAWWWSLPDRIPGDPSLQPLTGVKGVMGWVPLVSKAENTHVSRGRLVWWKAILPGCLGAWSPPRCNYVQWILKSKQKCVKVFIVFVSG